MITSTDLRHATRLFTITIGMAIVLPTSATSVTTSGEWPQIYGQAGSYEAQSRKEVTDMATLGMHLLVKKEFKSRGELEDTMRNVGTSYIDSMPWDMLFWTRPQLCSSADNRCSGDPEAEQLVLQNIRRHVEALSTHPEVAGYWILDDYPGSDIHGTLEKIHAEIRQVNERSHLNRPTVCGIGVPVYADQPHHSGKAAFEAEHPSTMRALVNFSPLACDTIGVYSYFYAHQRNFPPEKADWSMQTMLPGLFEELRARGWTPEAIIIGIPQAFYNIPRPGDREFSVVPRAVDVATQTASFCKAGAIAITAFSWDDGNGVRREPFNTPTLRDGLVDGVRQCQTIWSKARNSAKAR